MILGYALVRARSAFLAMAESDCDGVLTTTWSHDDRDALLLPTRLGAFSLAWAIGAGPEVEIAAAIERQRMGKRQIRELAAKLADQLVHACGDADAAREAWIDVGGNNAGWKRRGAKSKSAKARKGAR